MLLILNLLHLCNDGGNKKIEITVAEGADGV